MRGHLGVELSEYADGRLAAVQLTRVQRHLDACPSCRDLLAAEQGTKRQLATLRDPDLAPAFLARLTALDAAPPPPPPGPLAREPITLAPGRFAGRPTGRRDGRRPVPAPWSSAPGVPGWRRHGRRAATALLGTVGVLAVLGAGLAVTPISGDSGTPVLSSLIERVSPAWHWPTLVGPAPGGARGAHLP